MRVHWLTAGTLLAVACGGGAPGAQSHPAASVQRGGAPQADDAEPCEGDKLPHPRLSAEQYAERIESPGRERWQQPRRVLEAIGVEPGMVVAEVGTGSGFWLPSLDEAVAPGGAVVAEDIDEGLLELARERVREQRLSRVELRLGEHDDAGLEPRRYDRILIVNTYHHVCDAPALLSALRRALAARGRLVVIDFREGQDIPVASDAHRIDRDEVVERLRRLGFELAAEHDFLRYQYLLEFRSAE